MAYRGSEAYDYNRIYGQQAYQRASTAPRRQVEPGLQPAPKPRVIKKSRAQLRAETRRSRAAAIKVMAVCAVFFALIAFQIYSRVQVDELDRQLNTINSEISVLESENTRLNMQLDSMISLEKVDEYAQNELGMVKVENYQVSYIDLSGGDSFEVSGGKIHRSPWESLKAYLGLK